MWYLLDASDGSFCVVLDKNILQSGRISTGDKVTFFYKGTKYDGVVMNQNVNHDVLNQELNNLRRQRRDKTRLEGLELPPKRKTQPTEFYGSKVTSAAKKPKPDSAPKMSEEEKKRQRILALNVKEAQKRGNTLLMSKVSKRDTADPEPDTADPDWNPNNEDDESQDSIVDLVAHSRAVKENRTELLKSLKDPAQKTSETESSSESVEELRRQNSILKMKLQMAYDAVNSNQETCTRGTTPDVFDDHVLDAATNSTPLSSDDHVLDAATNSTPLSSEKDESSKVRSDGANDGSEKEDSRNDDLFEDADTMLEYQLYGESNDTSELCRKIFCKTEHLRNALTASTSVNHLVRRLMLGVFIPSKIADCSVTGASWHAGGADKLKEMRKPLHQGALRAITEFANLVAKKKKWHLKKFEKCKAIFSNRLVEIRKAVQQGKIAD